MQWLIDLIQAWVQSQGYLTESFIDRGDPRFADWGEGDFTHDNAWHDLDLSGIVPVGAKCVLIRVWASSFWITSYFDLRMKGNSWNQNSSVAQMQVSGQTYCKDMTCALNGQQVIQYRSNSPGWNFLNTTVRGWWL